MNSFSTSKWRGELIESITIVKRINIVISWLYLINISSWYEVSLSY